MLGTMPSIRDQVPDAPDDPIMVSDPRVFVEQAPHEVGFAAIYERVVVPRLNVLARAWNRAAKQKRWVRPIIGLFLIGLLWTGIWTWEAGRSHLSIQIFGGFITLLLADLVLRRGTRPLAIPGHILRDLLVEAACAHVEGLSYQRVAGRRINHDRFVTLGMLPTHRTSLAEDYFEGSYHDMTFRMVEAELRTSPKDVLFHGLLIEIAVPQPFKGTVAILQGKDTDRRGYRAPPGENPTVRGHPDFARRFDVFARDEDEMYTLLTASMMTALVRFEKQLDGAAFQAGFAFGNLMIAVPMQGNIFDPSSPVTGKFTPVEDAHLLLRQVNIPMRLIDTMHGIDPDTGGRYRA
jgi:hypothetical protein